MIRVEYIEDKPVRIELRNERGDSDYIEQFREYSIDPDEFTEIYPGPELVQCKVSMINSDFQFAFGLKTKKTFDFLSGLTNDHEFIKGHIRSVQFDEDRKNICILVKYVPLNRLNEPDEMTRKRNMKKKGEISIQIFSTGCIMISGGIHSFDVLEAFYMLLNVVSCNKEIQSQTQFRRKKKYLFREDLDIIVKLLQTK
jgi:hypothetical protein